MPPNRSQSPALLDDLRRIEIAYRLCGLPFPGGYKLLRTFGDGKHYVPRTLYDHVAVSKMLKRISKYADAELAAQVLQQLNDQLLELSAARGIAAEQADWFLLVVPNTTTEPIFGREASSIPAAAMDVDNLAPSESIPRKTQVDDPEWRAAVRRMRVWLNEGDELSGKKRTHADALAVVKQRLESEGRLKGRLARRLDVDVDGRVLIYWFPKLETWEDTHPDQV